MFANNRRSKISQLVSLSKKILGTIENGKVQIDGDRTNCGHRARIKSLHMYINPLETIYMFQGW